MHPRQQRRISPSCRGVNGNGLLGAEAVQVVRAAGLGASAAQAFAAKGLHADHGADHVAVDVDVADVRGMGHCLGPAVDAGLDAQGEAVAQRVDLINHVRWLAAPTHHLQHGAKDFGLDIGDASHFEGMRRNQVCYDSDSGLCRFHGGYKHFCLLF